MLPELCVCGARVDRAVLFAELVDRWRAAEQAAGRDGMNKSLAAELQPHYPTVRVQRISNWLNNKGVRSYATDDVLMYLCWKLGLEVVLNPTGVYLRKVG